MTDRTAFEAHFKLTQRQQAQHKDGSYRDASIQDRWLGWQAATVAAQEPKPRCATCGWYYGHPSYCPNNPEASQPAQGERQPEAWTTVVDGTILQTYDPDCAEVWRKMGATVEPMFRR